MAEMGWGLAQEGKIEARALFPSIHGREGLRHFPPCVRTLPMCHIRVVFSWGHYAPGRDIIGTPILRSEGTFWAGRLFPRPSPLSTLDGSKQMMCFFFSSLGPRITDVSRGLLATRETGVGG